MSTHQADVIIVGAGLAGSIAAYQLGLANLKVLVLEAGSAIPPNRTQFMETFYTSTLKTPESPYPPQHDALDPAQQNAPRATIADLINGWQNPQTSYLVQKGPLAFTSTYERLGGGTMWHWMGTALRLLPNDFRINTLYGVGMDWPIGYDDLMPYYELAEGEIGVSANVADQSYLGVHFRPGYQYPMHAIPASMIDQAFSAGVDGHQFDNLPLQVTPTPAGRNSQSDNGRRVCAGNTNCTPICPIQAKYDATVTMNRALDTGNVTILYQTVASRVLVGDDKQISGIEFIQYDTANGPPTGQGVAVGQRYMLAAHAIETPKLLLNSANSSWPKGVANSSGQVGCSLADHPVYLAWGMMPEGKAVYPYRGPIATSGIESLRDGPFRNQRAPWRIEIGNAGWNWPAGDPYTTVCDLIDGTNNAGANPLPSEPGPSLTLSGTALVQRLNSLLIRQFRIGFLVEQVEENPDKPLCYIVPSKDYTDHLNIPRPEIHYDFSPYTRAGFKAARQAASYMIRELLGADEVTNMQPDPASSPGIFTDGNETFSFSGAGHVMGTYRMGSDPSNSVVNQEQRSWDHSNLYLVGDGVFPSTGTANPSLTIAALTFRAADSLATDLLGKTVTVQANQAWQGTGVQVDGKTRRVSLYEGGSWTANPANGMVDADGHAGLPAKAGYTLPGANEGALIGRIGSSGPAFLLGNQGQLPRGQSGELQLCINDDLTGEYGAGLTDNQGSLQIQIGFGSL